MPDSIELRMERAAARGCCLGRHGGKIVFVSHTLPGERVRVALVGERRDWARARLLEVLIPSPERVDPPCPHYGPEGCGGCHWQHASERAQLDIKRAVVGEQLRRIGGLTGIEVEAGARGGEAWAYRNNVRLRMTDRGAGYVSASGGRVVPVRECPVMHPRLAGLFDRIKGRRTGDGALTLRVGTATGDRMVIMEGDPEPTDLDVGQDVSILVRDGSRIRRISGGRHLFELAAGYRFRISPGGFFQVNTAGAETLVQSVLARLPERIPGVVLDLYGGVGLFGLPLAERAERVVLIESHPGAAADARHNARAAGLDNLTVTAGDVNAGLKNLEPPVEAVVIDPPRRGCGAVAAARIAALNPRDVVYVSCDPATLARDLGFFRKAGYRPVFVRPVDLFPQTFHVETVVHLTREPGKKA